jgi:hypothetical protein
MMVRGVIASLGMVARAMMQPGPNLDLYFKDRYVVVSKRSVVLVTLVVVLIPVSAMAVWLRRSTHR